MARFRGVVYSLSGVPRSVAGGRRWLVTRSAAAHFSKIIPQRLGANHGRCSAIRAGQALLLNTDSIGRGLTVVQTKLANWSTVLGKTARALTVGLPRPPGAIARFASSPAGMFAGLLTAAKTAATSGTAMADMAEKAGTSVEAISALGYAARRSHVEVETLAGGIRKMQVNITAAAQGNEEAGMVLYRLGLSAAELMRLSPDEQFRELADHISRIPNLAARAAEAVKIFGRAGTELMPLLLQGSDGIGKWEEKAARALGLVASGEAAEGARTFGQMLGDLEDVLSSSVRVIGSALIPKLTKTAVNWIIANASIAARGWIPSITLILSSPPCR